MAIAQSKIALRERTACIAVQDSHAPHPNLPSVFRALALALTVAVPAPRAALPDAAPQILYAHVSSERIRMGDWWSGRIVTTTNVASVVVSLPFFSFVVPRDRFGVFSFRTHVLAVPDLYRQNVYGSIIAYNTAGASVSLPLEVDFR